jgi:GT2 family glycosyltransferase
MFSVVIPTYRSHAHLNRCLKSLSDSAEQARSTVDVNIMFNGPKPLKIDEIEFPNLYLKVFESRPNSVSAARNLGVEITTSEWILFLDDDVAVSLNFVEKLKVLTNRNDIDVVCGRVLLENKELIPNYFGELGQNLICNFDLGDESQFIYTPGISANLLVRREVFEQIGTFREDLGRNGRNLLSNEDTDFCLRAIDSKHRIFYSSELVVFHENHPDRSQMKWFVERMFWQGISDTVMGRHASSDSLDDALKKIDLDDNGMNFISRLTTNPSNAAEFENKMESIRQLASYFTSYSIQNRPKAAKLRRVILTDEAASKDTIRVPSSNGTILFIEFQGNHPGNFEYVYSKLKDSIVIRIPINPWIDPKKTFSLWSELKDLIPKGVQTIVFLTGDPLFWNHHLIAKEIQELSKKYNLVAYVHRTNREIQQGLRATGKYFTYLLMYGASGPEYLSKKLGMRIISSPIPSFNQSHFNFEPRVSQNKNLTFGLIGEFRREKHYKDFLDYLSVLSEEEKNKVEVHFFGRDKDGTKARMVHELNRLKITTCDLAVSLDLATNLDRHFMTAISAIDVLVSAYGSYQEISASGPIAEALSMKKKIFISEGSWLYQDLQKFSPNSLFNQSNKNLNDSHSELENLVSSASAIDLIVKLSANE